MASPKDYTNQITGRIRWIEMTDERYSTGSVIWLGECLECGNEYRGIPSMKTLQVKNGTPGSCGCLIGRPVKDYTGQTTGRIRWLISTDDKRGVGIIWVGECLDCGSEYRNVPNDVIQSVKRGYPGGCGCGRRLADGIGAAKNLFATYRWAAGDRKHPFDLTFEDFYEIIQWPCVYCGRTEISTSSTGYSTGDFKYTGLDQKVAGDGYTLKNVQPCCKECNQMKMARSDNHMYEHAKRIVENFERVDKLMREV